MSGNPAFECQVVGCEVQIPAMTEAVQLLFLQTHNKDAHGAMQVPLEQHRVGES